MENGLSYNLQTLRQVRDTIFGTLNRKGVMLPQNAKLSHLPQIINDMSTERVVVHSVESGLVKGSTVGLRFAICSDIHIHGDNESTADIRANSLMARLGTQYQNGELDLVVCCGDLHTAEAPAYETYIQLKSCVDNWKTLLRGCPIFFVPGNHDTITGQNGITAWSYVVGQTPSSLSGTLNGMTITACSEKVFRIDYKGEVLLFYGGYGKRWSAKDSINTAEERQWIMNQLDSCADMGRVFMFTHFYYPLDDFGFRYTGGKYLDNSGDSDDLLRVYETIALTYTNLIWVSGHSHTAWQREANYPTIKAHSNNSARLVACPSLAQQDNNQYGIIRCYNDMAVLTGMDNANGNAVPSANYFFPKAAESQNTYYSVGQDLTGLTSSFAGVRIIENGNLVARLALNQYYSNPVVSVVMGGVDITSTAYDSSTMTISIAEVTGNVVITASATMAGFYSVTTNLRGYTYTGDTHVIENESLQANLSLMSGYSSGSIHITMDGTDITSSVLNGDFISIAEVTGDIVITATAIARYSITTTADDGITIDLGQTGNYVSEGDSLTGSVIGSGINVVITMGGIDITSSAYNVSTGLISIPNVTGNIIITATNASVSWADYVCLELDVLDISSPTRVFNNSGSMAYITNLYIDGIAASVSESYQFNATGKHTIYFKSTDNKIHTALLNKCDTLVNLSIPSSITAISAGGNNPMVKNSVLNKVQMIAVSNIGAYTFQDCISLEEVDLGNVQSIADYAFSGSDSINNIRFASQTAPVLASHAFPSSVCSGQGEIIYPSGADYSSLMGVFPNWTFTAE